MSSKNAEFLTVITKKSIIHHAKHIGLHSVVLCTISAFWTVADVYSAENVRQIMNLKAMNRYILQRSFEVIYAII